MHLIKKSHFGLVGENVRLQTPFDIQQNFDTEEVRQLENN